MGAAQHHLLLADLVGLEEIAEEPYIMLTVDEAAHSSLKYWSASPYQPQVILRTSSVEAVRSLVANGQGVAILSDMVHRPWSLEGRRIETINVRDPIPAMDVVSGLGGVTHSSQRQWRPFAASFRQTFYTPNIR